MRHTASEKDTKGVDTSKSEADKLIISDEVWSAATSAWIGNHVSGSAIAQSTEAWNCLLGVLKHLRNQLNANLEASHGSSSTDEG